VPTADPATNEADPDGPEGGPADEAQFSAAPDPDRVLRLRLVFAAATLLVGSLFSLFALTVLSFAFSGRVSLLFSAAGSVLALGVLALLPRALLRALSAWRPQSDELRSAAGFSSLIAGLLLLGADAAFLAFTVSVLLTFGGASALFLLPLAALVYATYHFVREATDDFRKRLRLRRETLLFLTSLGYFLLLFFVFTVLAAALVAEPFTLKSPAEGSTICAGTVLDFEASSFGSPNATWDNGSGPRPLAPPYDVSTALWAPGSYFLNLTATDSGGSTHLQVFHFTVGPTPCT